MKGLVIVPHQIRTGVTTSGVQSDRSIDIVAFHEIVLIKMNLRFYAVQANLF